MTKLENDGPPPHRARATDLRANNHAPRKRNNNKRPNQYESHRVGRTTDNEKKNRQTNRETNHTSKHADKRADGHKQTNIHTQK